MDPIIQTVELHKHFGRDRALDGLNLEVHRGEIHGVLGPNGAGKSIYLAVPALVSVLWPRATIGVGWALLAAGAVLGIFGGMVGLNQDIRNISPFSRTMLAIAVVTGAVAVVVMSAAAVSGAVRYLQTVGYVQRISQPGSRRDLYALHDDEWYIASLRKSPIYQSLAVLTDAIAESLPAGSAAGSRVTEMGRFYRFLNARMPALLDDWERERNTGSGDVLTRRPGHDHHR